jgi:hypothetical protein
LRTQQSNGLYCTRRYERKKIIRTHVCSITNNKYSPKFADFKHTSGTTIRRKQNEGNTGDDGGEKDEELDIENIFNAIQRD